MSTRHQEVTLESSDGYLMFAVAIIALFAVAGGGFVAFSSGGWWWASVPVGLVVAFLAFSGIYSLSPNEAAVITLFGAYKGTDRTNGLRWVNPFYTKRIVSLRMENFIGATIKVNDQRRNPIEVAAAIAYHVEDTAQATFGVESYAKFVQVTAESTLREIASRYPYDASDVAGEDDASVKTLSGHVQEVAADLLTELRARLDVAGVKVVDAKLTHLAYAPEIAGVMLRRQQADAVIAARSKIVKGAVGMVEDALKALDEKKMVSLDDERKAAMVSNLLVVLVSEKDTSPVINTGGLYQ